VRGDSNEGIWLTPEERNQPDLLQLRQAQAARVRDGGHERGHGEAGHAGQDEGVAEARQLSARLRSQCSKVVYISPVSRGLPRWAFMPAA
jgi:hypothetical protein